MLIVIASLVVFIVDVDKSAVSESLGQYTTTSQYMGTIFHKNDMLVIRNSIWYRNKQIAYEK